MNDHGFPLPQATSYAHQVDAAFFAVLGIAGGILLLLLVLTILFLIRYRRGTQVTREPLPRLLRRELEIGWTAATTFLALFIFWWFVGRIALPAGYDPAQLEIHVVAKQWMWKAEHPDGAREIDALHLPLGRMVRLVMTSEDVIHSFFVPAFRLKQDVLPGRSTQLVFTPSEVGDFHLFCAEYCGTQHSRMKGDIVVMPPADYERWLHAQPHANTIAEDGKVLFATLGCAACHQEGSPIEAPRLVDLLGRQVTLQDGRRVLADEAFARHAILQPRDETVAGFGPVMPSYASVVSASDLDALLAYLKSQARPASSP